MSVLLSHVTAFELPVVMAAFAAGIAVGSAAAWGFLRRSDG